MEDNIEATDDNATEAMDGNAAAGCGV